MNINEIYNEKIDERLFHSKSNNGLDVYYMPKKGYAKQFGIFSTNYGSIDNVFRLKGEDEYVEVPEGIAHFLEHKLFEEPDTNIHDEFSRLGSDVNAFTSFNQTSYVFESMDNFYESLELLIKFVQNPYLTDENVEKEKGIIGQEITMYDDNPGWRVYFNLLNALYEKHPVRIDIAGTIETISHIDKELLYKSYNTFYHPSNMVLFVIGDLDFEEIMKVVNKSEKEYEDKALEIERYFSEEPDGIYKRRIEESMMVPKPLFYIGYKDRDIGYLGVEKVKRELITDIILDCLFDTSSEFYNELYEEGLIDSSFGAYYTGDKTYGSSIIVGQADDPDQVHDRIKDYLKKPVEEIILEEDFLRIKKKNIGEFLFGLNSIEAIANGFVDMYFDEFSIMDLQSAMEEIKYEDLAKRFEEHFIEEYSAISIINPIDTKEEV